MDADMHSERETTYIGGMVEVEPTSYVQPTYSTVPSSPAVSLPPPPPSLPTPPNSGAVGAAQPACSADQSHTLALDWHLTSHLTPGARHSPPPRCATCCLRAAVGGGAVGTLGADQGERLLVPCAAAFFVRSALLAARARSLRFRARPVCTRVAGLLRLKRPQHSRCRLPYSLPLRCVWAARRWRR